jgi:PAS domain S-box-containing protein
MKTYGGMEKLESNQVKELPDLKSPYSRGKHTQDEYLSDEQDIITYIAYESREGWVLCDFQGNIIDLCITNLDFNIPQQDFIGQNICDFVDDDLREETLHFVQRVKQDGIVNGIQHIMLINGEKRSFAYKLVAVYDGDEPVGVKIFVGDITDKIREKQNLKTSETRYRGVFENTGLPIVILEENLLISMVNVRFEELSGYSKNEIEEKMSFAQFIDEEAKEGILKLFLDKSVDFPSDYECRLCNRASEVFDMIIRFNSISSTGQMIATFIDITARKRTETELLKSRDHLRKEVSLLRSSLKERYRFGDIIGKSQVMQEVYETIAMAAHAKANVIIYGESGTGKDLVARAIHQMSSREQKMFVTVNCGAIPENIIESEFFGYKKGAFTGAYTDKQGYFDVAHEGTLFLDEVGELNLNMQAKLLRVIDGGGYTPLGSNKIRKTDVRIISATNRNLQDLIREKSFREDLFYRLHIITIYLPPLRERKEDIPLLIDHFIKAYGAPCPPVTGKIMDQFLEYDWPGNVRELQNVVHRYISMKRIDFIGLPKTMNGNVRARTRVKEIGNIQEMMDAYEKEIIENALNRFRWRRAQAAAALGINRRTLFDKMIKYGIQKSQIGNI